MGVIYKRILCRVIQTKIFLFVKFLRKFYIEFYIKRPLENKAETKKIKDKP